MNSILPKEKHVLHVVGAFQKGGTESFIINYFNEMKKQGFIFDIYCFNVYDEKQKKRIIDLGGNFFAGPAPSKKGLFKAIRHFNKFLDEHDYYDVIHCNANFDSAIYAKIAHKHGIARVVCHAHDALTGIHFNLRQKLEMKFKRRICVKHSNKLLACSTNAGYDIFGKEIFDKLGVVIANAINPESFLTYDSAKVEQLYADYKIPRDKIVLGNISRFEDKKNQQFLIKLFEKLSSKSNDYFLVLGGVDGGNLAAMMNLASKQNNIIFIGPRDDVNDWLHVFNFYLMPSLFEGFGIAALESQIAGCPTIVSNNVPLSIDLKLDLVRHLELDLNDWLYCLEHYQKPKVNREQIVSALRENGFDIVAASETLKEIYL